jgi:hypothetical protein
MGVMEQLEAWVKMDVMGIPKNLMKDGHGLIQDSNLLTTSKPWKQAQMARLEEQVEMAVMVALVAKGGIVERLNYRSWLAKKKLLAVTRMASVGLMASLEMVVKEVLVEEMEMMLPGLGKSNTNGIWQFLENGSTEVEILV